MEKIIKFKKLHDNAQLPSYAHDGDIGMDVFATSIEYDSVNDVYVYHTGLACETEGHMGVLGMMKSSVFKHGDAYLTNAVGLIDSDQYRGEILFMYKNRTSLKQRIFNTALRFYMNQSVWNRMMHSFDDTLKQFEEQWDPYMNAPYSVGEAIGQLVPLTFDKVKIVEAKELSETDRGEGGFGSSDASKTKPPRKSSKKYKEKTKEK